MGETGSNSNLRRRMEPQTPATSTSAPSQPSEPSQSQPSQPPQPLVASLPPSSSSSPSPSAPVHSSPNPNPIQNQTPHSNSKPLTPLPHPPAPAPSQPRPPTAFNRNLPQQPQQQQQSHYSHFSSPLSSLPPPPSASVGSGSSFSSTGSPSIPGAPAPRGGMAIGVPAHHQNPSPPFSSSFGQHFGGLGRTGVNVSDSTSNSNAAQVGCCFLDLFILLFGYEIGAQSRRGCEIFYFFYLRIKEIYYL